MGVIAGSDWVIDVGPGAGDEGGRVCASGPPAEVAEAKCRTGPYLARYLSDR
jgi:excinuclease ABC subunit A